MTSRFTFPPKLLFDSAPMLGKITIPKGPRHSYQGSVIQHKKTQGSTDFSDALDLF